MTKNEVELTLERLERLAIIRKTPKGYQPVKARLLVQSLQFNSAQQKYYRSVLAKLNARIGVPEPPKVLATEVLSFNVEDLPEVRKITHRYLDRLIQISKKQKNPSQIYQSIVGFFPLEQDFT